MPNENPKTTIYLQAIITTDAVPDFSFFRKLTDEASKVALKPGFPSTHNEECHCGGMTSNAA